MSNRLSRRLARISASPTVSITALASRLREQGRDVITLSVGEPDFTPPPHVQAAAIAAIEAGDTRYTPVAGSTALREAVVGKFRRDNHLSFDPDQILVTSGAKQACYNACQALLDPGDEAIVVAPYWVSYPDIVRLAGAKPVIIETAREAGFRLSADQLAEALSQHTRLLILNSPSNPTGAVHTAEDWRALGNVLADYPRVMIVADDIYEHIYWDERPFATFAGACPELIGRTITVNGVSKCYAMSGWRIGYAAGPRHVIAAMTTLQSQSTTSACTVSQAAAVAALSGDQSWLPGMAASFRRRHDLVLEAINAMPGFSCDATSGTFYVFPDISEATRARGLDDDVAFCSQLLEETGVALVPGSAFGAPGHLRISFAVGEDTLREALHRIRRFINA